MDLAQPVWIGAGFAFHDQARPLGVGGENGLERTGDAVRRFLGNIAEPRPARQLDRPFVGIELADDRLHQRRLAGAVAADQPHAASRRDRGGCALKYRPPAEADRNSVDGQHVGALASNRRVPKAARLVTLYRASDRHKVAAISLGADNGQCLHRHSKWSSSRWLWLRRLRDN